MDFLRSHGLIRYGFIAALIAAAAYVAPSVWAEDRAATGIAWFEHLSFLFVLVLAFAALRVEDAMLRARLTLGVVVGFSVLAAVVLGFSVESLALVGLAALVSYLEWPRDAAEARTY